MCPVAEVETEQVPVGWPIEMPAVAPGALRIVPAGTLTALRAVEVLPVADRAVRHIEPARHFGVRCAATQQCERHVPNISTVLVHVATLSE